METEASSNFQPIESESKVTLFNPEKSQESWAGQLHYKQKKTLSRSQLHCHFSTRSLEAMVFQKEYLDVVLVPLGLLIMLIYHLFLLYNYLNHPLSTAIGSENIDKKIWVGKVLQGDDVGVATKVKTALDVISSNTSATTTLASISLTLCSLIGAWMANSANNFLPSQIIYGNTNPVTVSIKYICILTCFLLAFSCFVESARHFVHSNYLLATPGATAKSDVKKAERAVQRGSEFWSLGLRALYFALNFLLWFFGPIPMLASSVATVVILSCHDYEKSGGDHKWPPSSAVDTNERLLLVS